MRSLLGQLQIANLTLLALMGVASFAAGILLMIYHRREWDDVRQRERLVRNRAFEEKKFRRRAFVAALISSVGAVMISLNWVVDPRTFSLLLVLMFTLLVAILILATVDLMSVGLHQMSTVDAQAKRAMIQRAMQLHQSRKQQAAEAASAEPATEGAAEAGSSGDASDDPTRPAGNPLGNSLGNSHRGSS
jgi:hypothetical protein